MEPQTTDRPTSSAGKLVIVWAVVLIPALWGVSQTVIKSLALFQSHATPAATRPGPIELGSGAATRPATTAPSVP